MATQIAATSTGQLATPRPLLETVAGGFLAGYGNPHTRDAYTRDLREWLAWCDEVGIEPLEAGRPHVELFTRHLEEQGRTPSTVARKLAALSGFYGFAADEGVLDRNPVDRVRRPQVPEDSPTLGLDRDEARAILDAATHPRDRLLVTLLLLNGLRVSEACGADVDDVGEERGHQVLEVRRKRGKREQVPLAVPTVEALDTYTAGRIEGPLLLDRDGNRLDRHDAARMVRRLARAAGITKHISPHSLRHTAVTLALDAGVPLRDVQDMAGHQDPRTTRRYDRARKSLDRHATYAIAGFLA